MKTPQEADISAPSTALVVLRRPTVSRTVWGWLSPEQRLDFFRQSEKSLSVHPSLRGRRRIGDVVRDQTIAEEALSPTRKDSSSTLRPDDNNSQCDDGTGAKRLDKGRQEPDFAARAARVREALARQRCDFLLPDRLQKKLTVLAGIYVPPSQAKNSGVTRATQKYAVPRRKALPGAHSPLLEQSDNDSCHRHRAEEAFGKPEVFQKNVHVKPKTPALTKAVLIKSGRQVLRDISVNRPRSPIRRKVLDQAKQKAASLSTKVKKTLDILRND